METNRATKTVGTLANVARLILRAGPFVFVCGLLAACEPGTGSRLRITERTNHERLATAGPADDPSMAKHEGTFRTSAGTDDAEQVGMAASEEAEVLAGSEGAQAGAALSDASQGSHPLVGERAKVARAFALAWEAGDIQATELVVSGRLRAALFDVRSWSSRLDVSPGDALDVSCREPGEANISSCFVLNCCGPGYFLSVGSINGELRVIDTDFVELADVSSS